MRCLLVFILTLLISTVSGVIETSFVKGVPRLNNSLYCDYYFACNSEGETLQWTVGNNVFNYSGQSTTGSVFVGSVSNCNYTATLLLSMSMPMSHSFKSALILSCQSNSSIPIICSDGIASNQISIPEKEVNVRAETINNSIYFERVLSQYLVYADNSTCTNVFVCGVNNRFMNVQLGNTNFLFSEFDPIGLERNEVQGTSVQQAILIDKEPYSLVVAMFIVGSEVMNVTCGFSPNILFFSSMQCPVTTTPVTSDTMESESTSVESESSTGGVSSTMASESSNILPLILGPSITIGVLLVVAVVVIIIIVFYYKERLKRTKPEAMSLKRGKPESELISLTSRPTDEPDSEIPLKDNNFSEIKKPKKFIKNIDYSTFLNDVQYIFLTRNENTFNAATTILTAPDIENTTNRQLTCIDEDVYIGMIGSHSVCLVNETGNLFVEKLKNVIINYLPNAKYLVFVGRCFGIDPKKLKLADIVISNSIRHADRLGAFTKLVAPEIRSKFCFYPETVQGLQVTQNRRAKHFVANVVSGVNLLGNENIRSFAFRTLDIDGCEETSGELVRLLTEIYMKNNTTKQMQIISIGAVTGYADRKTVNKCDEWQFMASQAAFHYVASKMIDPHSPGQILYEVKKPKPKGKNTNEFAKQVKYIIITIGPDEFDAVTSYISAPNLEENIIEIIEGVYIGKIGSHSVGLLYLQNCKRFYRDMKNAIVKYFPHSEYLIHVGGCSGIDPDKTKLGDVLISKEIYNITFDGQSYNSDIIEMTPEIQNIFCNSYNVQGLQLPGNRTAKHFEVRIATGTGADIEKDECMKTIAIETRDNYGYDEVGGDIFLLQKKMATSIRRKIHFILINGVCCYKNSRNYDEWDFVASQAAIHYVASKIYLCRN